MVGNGVEADGPVGVRGGEWVLGEGGHARETRAPGGCASGLGDWGGERSADGGVQRVAALRTRDGVVCAIVRIRPPPDCVALIGGVSRCRLMSDVHWGRMLRTIEEVCVEPRRETYSEAHGATAWADPPPSSHS